MSIFSLCWPMPEVFDFSLCLRGVCMSMCIYMGIYFLIGCWFIFSHSGFLDLRRNTPSFSLVLCRILVYSGVCIGMYMGVCVYVYEYGYLFSLLDHA